MTDKSSHVTDESSHWVIGVLGVVQKVLTTLGAIILLTLWFGILWAQLS